MTVEAGKGGGVKVSVRGGWMDGGGEGDCTRAAVVVFSVRVVFVMVIVM